MSDFNLADLRTWRKKHGFSQDQFAKLADLGINTVLKIESGKHKVQAQTFDKILNTIRTVESQAKGPVTIPPAPKPQVVAPVAAPVVHHPVAAPVAAPVVHHPVAAPVAAPVVHHPVAAPVAAPVVHHPVAAPVAAPVAQMFAAPVPKAEPMAAKPSGHYNPIQLTNLDIEIIHRILLMSGREKLQLLETLMG